MLDSTEIGLKLLQTKRVSLLKIDTALAILHIFGNTPVVNDLFIRMDKGMKSLSRKELNNFVEEDYQWKR